MTSILHTELSAGPKLSTGAPPLDALLEELRAGDNVVFYTPGVDQYLPFALTMLQYAREQHLDVVYVRASGEFDAFLEESPQIQVIDVAHMDTSNDPLTALTESIELIGRHSYTLFDPLKSFECWFETEIQIRNLFLSTCPLLFRLGSVAYWQIDRKSYSSATVAAIKDCTQILIRIDTVGEETLLVPLKVWGRYSDAMLQSHRLSFGPEGLNIQPLPVVMEDSEEYVVALANKNRELAEIRDALNYSNQELLQRNQDLATLNERLSEQVRLYDSLRQNLEHILALFRAGQDISSSLAVDHVRQAIVTAALRLFDAHACRLCLRSANPEIRADVAIGMSPLMHRWRKSRAAESLSDQACETTTVAGCLLPEMAPHLRSAAFAPITSRGECLGTLELYADDERMAEEESLNLLGYLASEASIALDNAHLYREVESQGKQLRSFVDEIIISEERESRQFAFDLHDGLVQIIVASYQHLQTAQAWRHRDDGTEERELAQGVTLLRQAIYEARRLIAQLRPAGLDDFGLKHAVKVYAAQAANEADWNLSLDLDESWPKLPNALEAGLFRIIQEATNNALKYAEADRISIRMQVRNGLLRLSIQDWGKGFVPTEVLSEPHHGLRMGLIGIRERTRLWGGHCEIDSQPGRGTRILVTIPLAQATSNGENSQ